MYTVPDMERIESRVSIDESLVPHFVIWSGKRAEGEDREPFIPFAVGDFVVSKYLGLQFVADKHCALRYHGLVLSGIATVEDELDIPLDLIKFEVAIVVSGELRKSPIAGKYSIVGWVTAKEIISVGQVSRLYGLDGRRYSLKNLRPLDELSAAVVSGKIDIDLEEETVGWWHN